MRRSTPAALSATALLVPLLVTTYAGPAVAAETCRGLPATVVGTGGVVRGTQGNDVIVARGAQLVAGYAGDDVICTLEGSGTVNVIGGPGVDVLDRSGDVATSDAEVFETETVLGSAAGERVVLVPDVPSALALGAGDDRVARFGQDGLGSVDLGDGDDVFFSTYDNLPVPRPARRSDRSDGFLTVRGGAGEDQMGVAPSTDQRWLLDLQRGTWSSQDGAGRVELTEMESYDVESDSAAQRFDVRGSSRADVVEVYGPSLGRVRLARGADVLTVLGAVRPKALVDGGRGRDRLVSWIGQRSVGRTVIDLARGRFGEVAAAPARLRGVEDVTVTAARRVDVVGGAGDNVLEWTSCTGGTVRGGPGDDEIELPDTGFALCGGKKQAAGMRAFGGAGDDMLLGTPYDDMLVGDRGYDTAIGQGGRDRCPGVEQRFSC